MPSKHATNSASTVGVALQQIGPLTRNVSVRETNLSHSRIPFGKENFEFLQKVSTFWSPHMSKK